MSAKTLWCLLRGCGFQNMSEISSREKLYQTRSVALQRWRPQITGTQPGNIVCCAHRVHGATAVSAAAAAAAAGGASRAPFASQKWPPHPKRRLDLWNHLWNPYGTTYGTYAATSRRKCLSDETVYGATPRLQSKASTRSDGCMHVWTCGRTYACIYVCF